MSLTKEDLLAITELLNPMKQDMQSMKQSLQKVEQRTTNIELKLENVTNHNIELLAENHMKLVDKLNQAIRVSDKTLLYEVQVSTLQSKMERLEEEVKELKRTCGVANRV